MYASQVLPMVAMLVSTWVVCSAMFSGFGVTSAIFSARRLANCKALMFPSCTVGTVRSS